MVPIVKLVNRLLKFTGFLVKVTRKSRIPLFSCRKSKRVYTQRQHITVLGVMKYLRTDYRGVIEQLALMPDIRQAIGLTQLPHFTTIHKFLQRFRRHLFDRLLSQTVNLFETGPCTLAIDGTGYSSTHSSEYYKVRTKRKRTFVLSIATVDTDNLLIVSQHSRKGMGENTWFRPLVSRASRLVDIDYVLGDMAYDCEANHQFVHYTIGARCIVPVRNRERKRVHGFHRKRLYRQFPEQLYHRRSLIETVFSVIKRRFGSFLQSRSLAQQNREVGLLCVVYNVYRHVTMKLCVICCMFSTQPVNFICYN